MARAESDICKDPSFRMVRGGGFIGLTYKTEVESGQASFVIGNGSKETSPLSPDHSTKLTELCNEVVFDRSLQPFYEVAQREHWGDLSVYDISIADKRFRVDMGATIPDTLTDLITLGETISHTTVEASRNGNVPQKDK